MRKHCHSLLYRVDVLLFPHVHASSYAEGKKVQGEGECGLSDLEVESISIFRQDHAQHDMDIPLILLLIIKDDGRDIRGHLAGGCDLGCHDLHGMVLVLARKGFHLSLAHAWQMSGT